MSMIRQPSLSITCFSMLFNLVFVVIPCYCKRAIMPTEALAMSHLCFPPAKIATTNPFSRRHSPAGVLHRMLHNPSTKSNHQRDGGRSHSSDRTKAKLSSRSENHDDTSEFAKPSLVHGSSSKEYIILSFDGIIADTSRQRARLTVDVALHLWPQLQDLLNSIRDRCGKETESTIQKDHGLNGSNIDNWLINKMIACSHVTQDHTIDGMLGCDDVLLARLLIEEEQLLLQETTNKQFTGKGKYASKFHPKIITSASTEATDLSSSDKDEGKHNAAEAEIINSNSCSNNTVQDSSPQKTKVYRRNYSRSRPLTVGEICANWNTGGHLRDTLRTRYNIGGNDPLPIIRENLETWLTTSNIADMTTSAIPPLIKEAVHLGCRGGKNLFILLNHEAYTKQALKILSTLNVEVVLQEIPSTLTTLVNGSRSPTSPSSSSVDNNDWCTNSPGRLTVLVGRTDSSEDTHVNMVKCLMEEVTDFSDFFFIHCNSHVLHDAKRLLYGDSPYTMKAQRKTRIGTQKNLALFLPCWRSKNTLRQIHDVELDPWITKINEVDFMELLTANKIHVES